MSFERECRACEFMLGVARRLLADITDAQLRVPASPLANPPRWILGHLAVVADSGLRLLGRTPVCPASWRDTFGPGSTPQSTCEPAPAKAELVEVWSRAYTELLAAARAADPAQLDQPHGVALLGDATLKTRADVLTHLLTSHLALHLGQLSAWRRGQGHAPLF